MISSLLNAPVLATLTRGQMVESVHHGVGVVLDRDGALTHSAGEVSAPIYPRSANKPLQAVAMLRAGLQLDSAELALASASHSGEDFHLAGVKRLLHRFGLSEEDLRNTPDLPLDAAVRAHWQCEGRGPSRLAQNCSGKHAAMLATCQLNGWDAETYYEPGHPLQVLIAETIADLAGEQVAGSATDGCGAPVFAISPLGLARAFATIATAAEGSPEAQVRDAMRAHPELVAGTGRDTTLLMRSIPGLISKDGAEAVHAAAFDDGRAVVIKIGDGADRARSVVIAHALRLAGASGPVLDQLQDAPVLGHGHPVGAIEAVDWT